MYKEIFNTLLLSEHFEMFMIDGSVNDVIQRTLQVVLDLNVV